MNLSLPAVRYPYSDPERIAAFYQRFLAGLGDAPGVHAVGITSNLPFGGVANWSGAFAYRAPEGELPWGARIADYRAVSPGVFRALGVRLVEGRLFGDEEDLSRPAVAIVDRMFARAIWPGESAVGKQLRVSAFIGDRDGIRWATVVGVVDHVRYDDPRVDGRDQIYLPHAQSPQRSVTLVVDSAMDAAAVERQVRSQLRALDAHLAPYRVLPISHYVAEARRPLRVTAVATFAFSGAAVLVSTLGVYLVLARATAERGREIGVRLALGASRSSIARMVVHQGVRLVIGGLAAGCAAGVAAGYALRAVLYQVGALDVPTMAGAACVTLGAAIAASLWPALRASRVDPSLLVRGE
jgi:hypothetical protein